MYSAAIPAHWVLGQMMNHANASSHSTAAFYTGCADLVPLLGPRGIVTPATALDLVNLERNLKSTSWTDNRNCHSPTSSKFHDDSIPGVAVLSANTKGIKRHLELGGKKATMPLPSGVSGLKRRSGSPDQQNKPNHTTQNQPPSKRALVATPPPSLQSSPHLPKGLLQCCEWDSLSEEIWHKFVEHQQTDEIFMRKMRLRDAVYQVLKEAFSHCGLYVVGSSMNGFGTNSSDMDMCLMLTHYEIDQKTEATNILRQILRPLKKCSYIEQLELIRAIVPILKFRDGISGVEVDLNVNNAVGIRNTHLLKCYSKMDWRVRPLVLIIKMWAREQNINDAKNMTISSYSLVLMVIHFLQCGVSPPVIPSLQKMYPHKFFSQSDVRALVLHEELPPYHSRNDAPLGQLLVEFLNYYSNKFDFQADVASVRAGGRLPKNICQHQRARRNTPMQWKCLCIEEPFELTNTARSVYNEDVFSRVKLVFQRSWRDLQDKKELVSILQS